MTRRRATLVCALLVLCTRHVGATVFAPAEWNELVLAARAIVHGRVADVRAQASGDRRRIETIVTVQGATYLKGNLGPTVSFRVPGGQLGRYRTVVLGAPQFVAGEEVVLLLGARGPTIPYVLGLSQGVLRVSADPASGERRVTPAPIVAEGGEWKRVVRGDPAYAPMSVGELAVLVERILGAQE